MSQFTSLVLCATNVQRIKSEGKYQGVQLHRDCVSGANLSCCRCSVSSRPLWITTISSQMWKIAKFTLQHNYPQLLIINHYYWLIIICIIDWQQKVCCGKFTFFPCSQWSTKKAQTIFIHYNVESRNQWNFAALAKATVGGLTPVTLTAAQHRLTLTLTSLPPPPMGKLESLPPIPPWHWHRIDWWVPTTCHLHWHVMTPLGKLHRSHTDHFLPFLWYPWILTLTSFPWPTWTWISLNCQLQ